MAAEYLKIILRHFDIPKDDYSITPVGHGLINKSYAVTRIVDNTKVYFLQQIDHQIFKDIEGLMQNIKVVNAYFAALEAAPNHLITIDTNDGANYYLSNAGEYWRLYYYVAGKTYHRAENEQMATEAGKMFGEYLAALGKLDVGLLTTTIPRFHDIDLRYEQFQASLVSAKRQRKGQAKDLIALVKDNIDIVKDIYHRIVDECPPRTTHNDTKLSNLLFDDNNRGICVIDYDTLMPGYWPLDFGDSIRTLCSTTLEEDTDIENTQFDMSIFKPFTTSFIGKLSKVISQPELKLLPASVPYMPFLMGLRMLTDYLNNDIYYSTLYENHNLDRAANQLALYKSGMALQNEMNIIVNHSLKNLTQ